MNHVLGLKCTICGAEYDVDEVEYIYPKHGNECIPGVLYDYSIIRQRTSPKQLARNPDRSMWRYKPLLPVESDSPVPRLQTGCISPTHQASGGAIWAQAPLDQGRRTRANWPKSAWRGG